MSKPCQGRDDLLLMFAHGQLSLFQRMQVQWHVRRCPSCSSRLARYSVLSSTLAVAMASGAGPRWLPSPRGINWTAPRSLLLGGIIALLSVGLWSLRNSAVASVQPGSGRQVQPGVAPGSTKGVSCHPATDAAVSSGLSPASSATVDSCEPQPSGSK